MVRGLIFYRKQERRVTMLISKTQSAQQIWQTALGKIQLQVNKANFLTWFSGTTGIRYESDQFIVGVPNDFVREWLQGRLYGLIEKVLIDILGANIVAHFEVILAEGRILTNSQRKNPAPEQRALPGFVLNPKYTFDTFIAGESNRLALTAAREVAKNPGEEFNPLYICGGPGVGKTHLSHAIGHEAQINGCQVLYVTAEGFTNDFVLSIIEKRSGEFRDNYRRLDVLIIDGIEFIVGKKGTENSLLYTLDALYNGGHQIVVTSDRLPGAMSLKECLRSRLEWGLVATIQSPDSGTLFAIAQAKKVSLGIDSISSETLEVICQRSNGIRALEGNLTLIKAQCILTDSPPTLDVVENILDGQNQALRNAPLLPAGRILNTVADYFGLSLERLCGPKRDRLTVQAKQVAAFLLRENGGYTFEQIGEELRKDHSTVIHSYNAISRSTNPRIKNHIAEIQHRL